MGNLFRRMLFLFVLTAACLTVPLAASAANLDYTSSTQFLWGDDYLSDGQAIFAQYLRFRLKPDQQKFSVTGYGRLWQDFGSSAIREDDFSGRLYYLYLDYAATENVSLRLGRQYVHFTSGSAIVDGAMVSVENIGPVGVKVAGGRDVRFSLDTEYSRSGNYFAGIDVHLSRVKPVQLGISYSIKLDESDRAREEFGANVRYMHRIVSPYAEVRYDRLSETFDDMLFGVDVYPVSGLIIKGEYYYYYPTFDSTSIYSVFAVDRYNEYLVRAEYSLRAPVTLHASYIHQTYEDSEDADVVRIGVWANPTDALTVNASIDYRDGYGGDDWGFSLDGTYRFMEKFTVFAGGQYDAYERPGVYEEFGLEEDDDQSAHRYWIGLNWEISKRASVNARIEDNINENFDHRPLGRVAFNWQL